MIAACAGGGATKTAVTGTAATNATTTTVPATTTTTPVPPVSPLTGLPPSDAAKPGAYVRTGSKPSPHNLYTYVTTLYGLAPRGAGPPLAQFAYRAVGQPATGAGAAPDAHIDLRFPGNGGPNVSWDWDAAGQN